MTIAALLRTPENAVRVPLIVHQAATGDSPSRSRASTRRSWAASSTRARAWPWSGRSCAASRGRAPASPRRRGASGGSFLAHAAVARAKLFRRVCAAIPRGSGRTPTRCGRRGVPGAAARRARRSARSPGERARLACGLPQRAPRHRARPGARRGRLRLPAAARRALRRRRAASRGLDASCARHVALPRFELS